MVLEKSQVASSNKVDQLQLKLLIEGLKLFFLKKHYNKNLTSMLMNSKNNL